MKSRRRRRGTPASFEGVSFAKLMTERRNRENLVITALDDYSREIPIEDLVRNKAILREADGQYLSVSDKAAFVSIRMTARRIEEREVLQPIGWVRRIEVLAFPDGLTPVSQGAATRIARRTVTCRQPHFDLRAGCTPFSRRRHRGSGLLRSARPFGRDDPKRQRAIGTRRATTRLGVGPDGPISIDSPALAEFAIPGAATKKGQMRRDPEEPAECDEPWQFRLPSGSCQHRICSPSRRRWRHLE